MRTAFLTNSLLWALASGFIVQPSSLHVATVLRSTVSLSEPMPWTVNAEEHGEFDQEEDWGWCYTTVPVEACRSYECTEIDGQVPKDLVGRFYRTGPGNFERGGRRYNHVLDGDGFVAAFSFDKGRVKYTGRFVETEYFLKEKEQDKVLYRNVFGTQREGGLLQNAFDLKFKNVANTNVLEWSDRLFALWEGGRPYELNRETLETLEAAPDGPFQRLGKADATRGITVDEGGLIDGVLSLGRSFTAHPHVLDDNTLVGFRAGQNPVTQQLKMEFVEFDKDWNEKYTVKYTIPGTPAAPHDFSISEDYFCLFQNRFDLDNLPFLLGLKSPTQVMQVPLDKPNILHLVPRPPGKKSLEFEIPSYFCIHNVAKAEQDGNKLTIYSNGWDLKDSRYFPNTVKSVPFLGSWGGKYPDFLSMIVPPAMLYRTVVDLEANEVISHKEVIEGLVMEFPTQDEREPHIIYCAASSVDYTSLPGTGHCKIDTKRDAIDFWWAEPKIFTGEMTPVAKRNGEKGSWLLTILYDAVNKRASLGIFDSERFEHGPICRIHLAHSLSYFLHGQFAEPKRSGLP